MVKRKKAAAKKRVAKMKKFDFENLEVYKKSLDSQGMKMSPARLVL